MSCGEREAARGGLMSAPWWRSMKSIIYAQKVMTRSMSVARVSEHVQRKDFLSPPRSCGTNRIDACWSSKILSGKTKGCTAAARRTWPDRYPLPACSTSSTMTTRTTGATTRTRTRCQSAPSPSMTSTTLAMSSDAVRKELRTTQLSEARVSQNNFSKKTFSGVFARKEESTLDTSASWVNNAVGEDAFFFPLFTLLPKLIWKE